MLDFNRFRREEDGALLVFFALCAAAIFLVAALSFDVGRRASTQTDLQSFADNVALAAAGELDGLPGAISRARRAADELIADSTRFTTSTDDDTLEGLADLLPLEFYETLPDDESAWPTPVSYDAAEALNPGDAQARFVRIRVDPVDVEWQFANVLSLFSSDPLPSEAVAAEATAGYTSLACDIAPIFFCMPPQQQVDADAGSPIWDPNNHLGESVLLRAGGQNDWGPGNFGFLDVVNMTPDDVKTDPASPCAEESGADLYSCLIGAESAVTLCFENGILNFLTGNGDGYTSATLNTKFDMYNASLTQEQSDPRFRPAPVVTKRYLEGDTCAPGGASTNDVTTDFPMDDCFDDSLVTGNAGCLLYGGGNGTGNPAIPRFGDGDWSQGRILYVENNYSIDGDSIGVVTPEEVQGGYHVDDPFRPMLPADFDGDGNEVRPALPRRSEYLDFPIVLNDAWRWHYYNAEVAAAYFDDPDAAYNQEIGEVDFTRPQRTTTVQDPVTLDDIVVPDPQDLITDYLNPDGTLALERDSTSLPHCAPEPSLNPRRRTVVAAVVDCVAEEDELRGRSGEGAATWFVEVFLPSVAGGVTTGSDFDIEVEIISGALQTGDPSFANGRFRNLVQLYR
ncbi:MAG: hypothetical protein HKN27_09260 [Silicimonas sp.]|nr:hypothetical protein [Silicimonas sp.]